MAYPVPPGSAPGDNYAWDPKQETWRSHSEFCAEGEIWNADLCACAACEQGDPPSPCHTWDEDACQWLAPGTTCPDGQSWDEATCSCQTCASCCVTLTVQSGCDGEPLAGASVGGGTTDANGQVSFCGLGSGDHVYTVEAGGETVEHTFTCPCAGGNYNESILVPPGSGCGELTSGDCTFTVTVLDPDTLQPVSGAVVTLDGATQASTNGAGQANFLGVGRTLHSVDVALGGYHSFSSSGSCSDCRTETVGQVALLAANVTPTGGGIVNPALRGDPLLGEDGDGIATAECYETCDRTPTFAWSSTFGSGDHRYEWRAVGWDDGAFVLAASGWAVDPGLTLEELDPGRYELLVRAQDGAGHYSAWEASPFTVADCGGGGGCVECGDPPGRLIIDGDGDGDGGGVPAEDVEPLVPLDPDYVRYYPRWHALYGTADAPGTDSFLYRLWRPLLREFRAFTRDLHDAGEEATLHYTPVSLPRLAWHLQTRYRPTDFLAATWAASGVSGEIRRAGSLREFWTSFDPIYLIGPEGVAVFRNLARRDVTVAPTGGVYTLPDEPRGIVGDAEVLFLSGDVWYRLHAGSVGIDARNARIRLPGGYAGTMTFRYQSRTLQTAVTVSLSGEPYRAPSRTDLWNRFDEFGVLAGLKRRDDEDNVTLRKRCYARLTTPPGDDPYAAAAQTAQDLGLVHVLRWNGRDALDFAASGQYGVHYVRVPGVPEIDVREEELLRADTGVYTAARRDWLPGWEILIDGVPASTHRYPALSVSGHVVRFGADVSGTVVARYRYRHYALERTSLGTITGLAPNTGNLPSGAYQVFLTRNVRLHRPADPTYQEAALLHPDGTPNGRLYDLRERLLAGSPLHLGRARWRTARWLTPEDRTAEDRLPAVFDLGGD